jgi:hypothetical protein
MKTFVANFDVELTPATVRKRVSGFLAGRGFKVLNDSQLIFGRGSIIGGLVSSTPKNWKSTLKVEISQQTEHLTHVQIEHSVNTFGQLVIQSEMAQLQREVELAADAIKTGLNNEVELNKSDVELGFVGRLMWGLVLVMVVTACVSLSVFLLLLSW